MTDIVKRLRALVILDEVGSDNPLGREAADEIELLGANLESRDAEIERLTAALDTCRELREYDSREIKQLRADLQRFAAISLDRPS